jgi:hypothetical protein
MPKQTSPIDQAELLLHLYELRREPVMRQARSYVGGPFNPASPEDLISSIRNGDQQTSYILQVFGYWDMLCAFVLHRALTEALVYDTCQEMYFQYAKIQPYLKAFRRELNLPEWMQNIEKVIEGSSKGRRRIAAMQASTRAILAARAKTPAPADPKK